MSKAPKPDKYGWRHFRKDSMPKPGTSVLVWLDLNSAGFPTSCFVDDKGRIGYWNVYGHVYLDPASFRTCRWRPIEPPEDSRE